MTAQAASSNDAVTPELDGADGSGAAGEAAPTANRAAIIIVSGLVQRGWAWRCPILLITLTIAAVSLAAGLFFFQYRPDRRIDSGAADQAVRAASDGAVALLSYSSDNLDRDFADAKSHLTGDFLAYYTKFTQEVVAPVVRDKHLVQRAVVIRAATSQLHPTSAVVLAFVNETVTSPDKKEPLITPSAVRVTLEKVDGTWLISKLDPVA